MHPTKNVFLTDDITIKDFEHNNPERYELTQNFENFLNFIKDYSKEATDDEKKTAESFLNTFPASLSDIQAWINKDEGRHNAIYEEWQETDSYEEIYEIPMMTALRYFPSFVSFDEEDRYKAVGNTTLLYDSDENAWAVGMTGAGMSFAPDLLATFINLEKGIPLELAPSITRDYSAYVDKNIHTTNCTLLALAFIDYGKEMFNRAFRLNPIFEKDKTIQRHLNGLLKALETIKN